MKVEIKKQPSESRKIRKPMMEKKRRARINDSLETLKQILLESKTTLKDVKKGERTAKLEKADILEMTVQYLQQLQEKDKENKPNYIRKDHRSTNDTLSDEKQSSFLRKQPNILRREPVIIRSADSSSENVKLRVTVLPTQLNNGQMVYLLPTHTNMNILNHNSVDSKQKVWRPW